MRTGEGPGPRESREGNASPPSPLSGVLDDVPAVVWEAWGRPDAEQQRIDFVSPYVETMLGYTVEEWLSTPNFWLSIVHPDDREQAAAVAAEAFARGATHTNRFRWLTRDGRTLWVEAHSTVLRDEAGVPIGMRGVTFDITAHTRAEENLRRREAQLQQLFTQTPFMLTHCGRDLRYVYVSRAYAEMVGRSPEDLAGKPIVEIMGEEGFATTGPTSSGCSSAIAWSTRATCTLPVSARAPCAWSTHPTTT